MKHLPARARRPLFIAVAIAALFALSAAAVHTPPVRSAVLSWAVARLRTGGGIQAAIGDLDYNLLTLGFSAHRITLAADGSDLPFFSADAIRVNVPWTVVRGRIAIESLEIDNPTLTIVRLADGTFNLPASSGPATDPLTGPIDVDRLIVNGLALRYEDRLELLLQPQTAAEVRLLHALAPLCTMIRRITAVRPGGNEHPHAACGSRRGI